MTFQLTSIAFEEGRRIPRQYTADGADTSPPLKWSDPPAETRSLALICEDPDAPRGIWTHWIVYNIPAESRELCAGAPSDRILANGTVQGVNDFGKIGYAGPAPPPGKAHRYFIKLYALDQMFDLKADIRREPFLQALKGRICSETQLMGTYARGEEHGISDDPIQKKAQQDRASLYTAPLS